MRRERTRLRYERSAADVEPRRSRSGASGEPSPAAPAGSILRLLAPASLPSLRGARGAAAPDVVDGAALLAALPERALGEKLDGCLLRDGEGHSSRIRDRADALAVVGLDVRGDLRGGFLDVGRAAPRALRTPRATAATSRPATASGSGAVREHAVEGFQRGLADQEVELGNEGGDAVLDL